jgi:hypothetical protein
MIVPVLRGCNAVGDAKLEDAKLEAATKWNPYP